MDLFTICLSEENLEAWQDKVQSSVELAVGIEQSHLMPDIYSGSITQDH